MRTFFPAKRCVAKNRHSCHEGGYVRIRSLRAAATIGFMILVAQTAIVRAAEIKVLSASVFTGVIDDIAVEFQRMTGNKVIIDYYTPAVVMNRIQANEPADVTILSRPLTDGLQQQGKVVPGSIVDIAHSAVAMAIRKGAPKPDISSVDGVKRALLAAKSITYPDVTRGGATGFLVTRVLEHLGIAEEMKPKTKYPRPGEFASAVLARGEADIAISQPMEVLAEAGIELVGLLPPELQSPQEFVFSASLLAGAKELKAAKAFIQLLSSPAAAPFLKAKGMQPG